MVVFGPMCRGKGDSGWGVVSLSQELKRFTPSELKVFGGTVRAGPPLPITSWTQQKAIVSPMFYKR
ncbi:hypothetical protein E2C01_060440 [Portunus trituberculatus]|uniref:Uncharacterized protein n=1 Tax=Portunus trituberculatus TaxID=210409 RepID=A0A5B7H824_PORTR|nr:hypothetical protein [Portunus trituberculatus]